LTELEHALQCFGRLLRCYRHLPLLWLCAIGSAAIGR